jgi:hypothetical protein
LVTAVADGTATIRATARDGSGVFGEVTVTVTGQSGAPNLYRVIVHFGSWGGFGQAIGKVEADHAKFTRLLRGGAEVDSAHYWVTPGSTVITLSEAYLRTLGSGSHTFVAEFSDGVSEEIELDVAASRTEPTIPPAPSLPFTGTAGGTLGLVALLLVSVGAALTWARRKRVVGGRAR